MKLNSDNYVSNSFCRVVSYQEVILSQAAQFDRQLVSQFMIMAWEAYVRSPIQVESLRKIYYKLQYNYRITIEYCRNYGITTVLLKFYYSTMLYYRKICRFRKVLYSISLITSVIYINHQTIVQLVQKNKNDDQSSQHTDTISKLPNRNVIQFVQKKALSSGSTT